MTSKTTKILCVALLLSLLAIKQGVAQLSKKISIGLKAGINATYVIQQNSSLQNHPSIGYNAGLAGSISFSKHILFMPALSFSLNRSTQKLPEGFYNEVIQRYWWLKIPMSFNFIFNPSSHYKFFIGAGTTLQELIVADAKYINSIGGSSKMAIYDQVDHFTVLGLGQAGLDFKVNGSEKVLLSLSYERSLSNLASSSYKKNIDFGYESDHFTFYELTLNIFYLFY